MYTNLLNSAYDQNCLVNDFSVDNVIEICLAKFCHLDTILSVVCQFYVMCNIAHSVPVFEQVSNHFLWIPLIMADKTCE